MLSKEENNNHGEGVNCKSQNIMRKSQEETLREMPVESYFPIVKPIISGRVSIMGKESIIMPIYT